jgi:hypothetical protein
MGERGGGEDRPGTAQPLGRRMENQIRPTTAPPAASIARPMTATRCRNPSTSRHRAEESEDAVGSGSGEEACASCRRLPEQEDMVRSPSARNRSRYYVGAAAASGTLVSQSPVLLPAGEAGGDARRAAFPYAVLVANTTRSPWVAVDSRTLVPRADGVQSAQSSTRRLGTRPKSERFLESSEPARCEPTIPHLLLGNRSRGQESGQRSGCRAVKARR